MKSKKAFAIIEGVTKSRFPAESRSGTQERTECMKKSDKDVCEELCIHEKPVQEAKAKLPPQELLQNLADFYKVFGDATRVKLLYVMLDYELCVCDLAEALGMTQSAISHQLRILKQMKLVGSRREGKSVFYSLADGHIRQILQQGMEHITE